MEIITEELFKIGDEYCVKAESKDDAICVFEELNFLNQKQGGKNYFDTNSVMMWPRNSKQPWPVIEREGTVRFYSAIRVTPDEPIERQVVEIEVKLLPQIRCEVCGNDAYYVCTTEDTAYYQCSNCSSMTKRIMEG